MKIALDATYGLGRNLSGVGLYSRELLFGLARAHTQQRFHYYYRPHRFLKSLSDALPGNASRRLLVGAPNVDLFHALNQRVSAPARRTIATFHDLFVMTGEYSSAEFRARFTDQARRAAERSDAIIAVSEFTASQVHQLLGVERTRIHVIPHGVRAPSTPGATTREPLILFVGAIQKRKNIARLVKAFEQVPAGWRLALAGATDGYGASEELRAVEASVRRADIDVLGYVSAEQRAALYSRASIFAFPSLDEGFGIPVLEAMAYGVAVVTSNCSALPEVAGDAALLVDPCNVEQLGAALAQVASDQDLRSRLIARGTARAGSFSWEVVVESTWALYQETMKR